VDRARRESSALFFATPVIAVQTSPIVGRCRSAKSLTETFDDHPRLPVRAFREAGQAWIGHHRSPDRRHPGPPGRSPGPAGRPGLYAETACAGRKKAHWRRRAVRSDWPDHPAGPIMRQPHRANTLGCHPITHCSTGRGAECASGRSSTRTRPSYGQYGHLVPGRHIAHFHRGPDLSTTRTRQVDLHLPPDRLGTGRRSRHPIVGRLLHPCLSRPAPGNPGTDDPDGKKSGQAWDKFWLVDPCNQFYRG
jgi:hypothetical protein